MNKQTPGIRILGLGLVALGAILALRAADSLQQAWPVLLAFGGVALIAQNGVERRKRPGLTFTGTLAVLLGVFFLLFTLNIARLGWADMGRLWPVIPLFVGVAFLMVYVAGNMRERALLVPMYVFGGVGLVALPVTLGTVQTLAFAQALRLWPLLLILAVLAVILRPTTPAAE